MKRIAFHVLLALALILQGVPAAFGTVLVSAKTASASSMPCCPDDRSMQADGDADAPLACPACPDCSCSIDCVLVCPACVMAPAMPSSFTLAPIPNSAAPLLALDRAQATRHDSPPTRPPIA